MDEGRNMCLMFPQLIEFEGSQDEQRKQREAFRPTYVSCLFCEEALPLINALVLKMSYLLRTANDGYSRWNAEVGRNGSEQPAVE